MTKAAKNCDVLHEIGYSIDGVFEILTGDSSVLAFCEFDQEGYNWMVRKYLSKPNKQNRSRLKRLSVSNSNNSINVNDNQHFL